MPGVTGGTGGYPAGGGAPPGAPGRDNLRTFAWDSTTTSTIGSGTCTPIGVVRGQAMGRARQCTDCGSMSGPQKRRGSRFRLDGGTDHRRASHFRTATSSSTMGSVSRPARRSLTAGGARFQPCADVGQLNGGNLRETGGKADEEGRADRAGWTEVAGSGNVRLLFLPAKELSGHGPSKDVRRTPEKGSPGTQA